MTASKEGTLPVADKRVSSAGDDAADEPPAAAPRDTWTNDWEFIMSCIALSIGLGNVWRFPFVALENGGGAFLIPYLIVLFLVGQPVYYVELLMGQFSSRGSIKVYDMVPAMRGEWDLCIRISHRRIKHVSTIRHRIRSIVLGRHVRDVLLGSDCVNLAVPDCVVRCRVTVEPLPRGMGRQLHCVGQRIQHQYAEWECVIVGAVFLVSYRAQVP